MCLMNLLLMCSICFVIEPKKMLFCPEFSEKYARPEDIEATSEEDSGDEEMSEDEYDSSDEAVAGQADP